MGSEAEVCLAYFWDNREAIVAEAEGVNGDEVERIIGHDPDGSYPMKILFFTLNKMGRRGGCKAEK